MSTKKQLTALDKQKNRLAYALFACVVMSFATYLVVDFELLSGWALILLITLFAFVQLVIQLVYFLDLKDSEKPRYNVMVLFYTIMTVFILVAGSIWIMYNLDYNHGMHDEKAHDIDTYIIEDEGMHEGMH